MSDDGFREGRPVRVNIPNSKYHGQEGRLVPRRGDSPETKFWHIDFDATGLDRTHSFFAGCLELLPDEPATPEPQPADDMVNTPPHYTQGGIECIDAIEAALTPEEFRGFLKGNVLKYTWRERHKGGLESLRKAGWYLRRLTGEPA